MSGNHFFCLRWLLVSLLCPRIIVLAGPHKPHLSFPFKNHFLSWSEKIFEITKSCANLITSCFISNVILVIMADIFYRLWQTRTINYILRHFIFHFLSPGLKWKYHHNFISKNDMEIPRLWLIRQTHVNCYQQVRNY